MKEQNKASEKIAELEQAIKELENEVELANKKAREKEEFYKLHLDNLNDVVFSVDHEGYFTYISPAIENFTGYLPEDVIGTSFTKYIYPNDLPGLLEDMELTIKGEHKPYMFRVIAKSGKITHVHTSSKPIIRNGKIVGLNGIMINIDQLKKVEFELMKEKEKAQHYLDVAGVVIIVIDKNFQISLVNKKACEVLGYKEHELLNKNYLKTIIPENARDSVMQAYLTSCDEGAIANPFECIVETKNGKQRLCLWKCTRIKDENGIMGGCILAGEDITDRKNTEESLLLAKMMAEDASRTKSEFIANMSHELRTPLNAVIGFSEILLEKKFGDINEKQEKYICNILSSGKHLLDIFNSMLEVSKIESEVLELNYETIELSELIEKLRKHFVPITREKEQELSFNINTDIKHVVADIEKVEQILIHLINNASKFSENGSPITVEIQNTDENIVFKVSDKGIGISEDNIGKLFNPFTQIDSSSTRSHGGLGLGLCLAKKHSELHGGSLNVSSEPNIGSTFTFAIPIKPETDTADLPEKDKI